MCPLCTSCDITGSETMAGSSLSLDQCKSKCLDDASCRGIDFGKGWREGQCYLNHGQNTNFGSHESFDGYSKNSDCGNFFSLSLIFIEVLFKTSTKEIGYQIKSILLNRRRRNYSTI